MIEKHWLKNYPDGIPHQIKPDAYKNMATVIETSLSQYADQPAFSCMGTTYSFRQINDLSDAFAAFLQKNLALKPGDRIAIMMPNTLQYPVVLFGAFKAGLIVVNTNPLYTPREMEHQFNDSGAKAIVIVENFAHQLQQIVGKTKLKHIIVTGMGDLLGTLKKPLVNFVLKRVKKMVPQYNLPNSIRFSEVLKQGKKLKLKKIEAKPTDTAMLQYTGGTTGLSKGAVLLHRNLVANMEQNLAWFKSAKMTQGSEVVITALPLYHIFAFTINLMSMLQLGAHNILIPNPRDMDGFIKELKKYPFTIFTGVNTLFNGLLNHPKFGEIDFSQLRVTVGGGAAVQKIVAEKWEQATGVQLAEGYGLTEASPTVSVNPLDGTARLGTIGLPLPSTAIRIVNDLGHDVPLGERGEIIVQGPQVMKGYYNQPLATAEILKNDWLYTGDIGIMDADGFVQIVDRKKDMILVSGFNVYPNEIENVIAEHSGVLEVAAIGVADERSGEAVKVVVVKKDPSLSVEQLKAYCKEHLTGYKVPKHYEFRDELPKSTVGKILRRKLK